MQREALTQTGNPPKARGASPLGGEKSIEVDGGSPDADGQPSQDSSGELTGRGEVGLGELCRSSLRCLLASVSESACGKDVALPEVVSTIKAGIDDGRRGEVKGAGVV